MIIGLENNSYIVKCPRNDIDIFDIEEIKDFVYKILVKIKKRDMINGDYKFNIFTNYEYGMIVEIDRINNNETDCMDIKINFNIESCFLEEVDYFYVKDSYNDKKKGKLYYYDGKFYREYVRDNYEGCNLIYGRKASEIVRKGIVVRIGK